MPKEATATWPIFTTELKNRKEVAERTMAFQFEKPAGRTFKAGRLLTLPCRMLLKPTRKATRAASRSRDNRTEEFAGY